MVASKIWSCVSPDEQEFFGEILMRFGSQFHAQSLQRRKILSAGVVDEGFVGPLETVATFTVLQHSPVIKPSWAQRDFLLLEHAHPSFLHARSL